MALSDEARRQRNEATVLSLMSKITTAQPIDEVADDFVMELIYGTPALAHFVGASKLNQAMADIYKATDHYTSMPVRFHRALDPNELIAEYKSRALVLPTGKIYENNYIAVFKFTDDGRIKFWREYHNPDKVAEAWPTEWTPSTE